MNQYRLRIIMIILCAMAVCFCCYNWIIREHDNSEVYNSNKTRAYPSDTELSSCSEGPLEIQWNGKRFKENELIIVSIKAFGGYPLPSIECEESGLSVVSIEKDENNACLDVSILMDKGINCGYVLISINTDDWHDRHGVYAIRTDRGIYIAGGYEAAWDDYYYSGYKDGLYSYEEYCRLSTEYTRSHQDDGVTTEIIVELPDSNIPNNDTKSPVETIITGTLKWKDNDDILHPLQYNKVQVFDYNTGSNLDYTYTNKNGVYSITLINDECPSNIRLVVYPGGANSIVKKGNGDSYNYEETHYGCVQGSTITINKTFNMSTAQGQAFQISQPINISTKYVKAMKGSYFTAIEVRYPHTNQSAPTTNYYSSGIIYICGQNDSTIKAYAHWDSIMHEYGHHVQNKLNLTLGYGGSHTFNVSLWNPDYQSTKERAIGLAWGEAYPTIFSELAQQYYKTDLNNIVSVGDIKYSFRSGTTFNYESGNVKKGEACEGSIIGVLWDLFDSVNESTHDSLSYSHANYWNIIKNSNAKTMSEFATYYCTNYVSNKDKFGKLLSFHSISPSSITWTASGNTAIIAWTANGIENHNNNRFNIEIRDNSSGTILLKKTGITTTSVTLTSTEYENITSNATSIKINIIGYQTNTPQTGGFVSKPKVVSLN